MRAAAHQPSFFPNFGYFYKMSACDIFIILEQCQFEKNSYTNRYYLQDKKKFVSKPVVNGMEPIKNKFYTDGQHLVTHNMNLIHWLMETLGIKTRIIYDIPRESKSTQMLIDNLKYCNATTYITSPSAKERYLDEDLIRSNGIEIEYVKPQFGELNILEMFERFGIDGTKKQLYKSKEALCIA